MLFQQRKDVGVEGDDDRRLPPLKIGIQRCSALGISCLWRASFLAPGPPGGAAPDPLQF